MSGNFGKRLRVIVALAMIMSLFGVSAAMAAPGDEFTLEVNPAIAAESSTVVFDVTFRNSTTSSSQLGSARVKPPSSFLNVNVLEGGNCDLPGWSASFVLGAVEFNSLNGGQRLNGGQAVTCKVTATMPSLASNDNFDLEAPWTDAEARIANGFEQNNNGNNSLSWVKIDRTQAYVWRTATGLSTRPLQTHENIVVAGTVVDCATQDCTASASESNTVVTVTIPACDDGMFIVDATPGVVVTQLGSAAWYYYTGSCPEGTPVSVHFLYSDKTVKNNEYKFGAIYPDEAAVLAIDPNYVGNLNPFPSCKQGITVNCVNYVKGWSGGTEAQITMLLFEDPGGIGFK